MTSKLFIAVLVLTVLLLAGCAPIPTQTFTATQQRTAPAPEPETINSSSLKNIDVNTYSVMPFLTADLTVDATKAVGIASGRTINQENLKREAMANALKAANRGQLDSGIADLIIEPTFFYETKGNNVTVTVIGYPARYRNFRTIEKPDWVDTTQKEQTTPARTQTQTPPPTFTPPPARPTTVTPIRLF